MPAAPRDTPTRDPRPETIPDAPPPSGLLRVCGLPVDVWTAAGNPELDAVLARLDDAEHLARDASLALADRVGRELVPNHALDRSLRGRVLAVRRALHAGTADAGMMEHLSGAAVLAGLGELAAETAATALALTAARDAAAAATDLVRAEEERLPALLARTLRRCALAHELVAATSADAARDVLAAGTAPPAGRAGRRLRAHAEFAWRQLTRATTDPTPRGWFAHVAVLPAPLTGALGDAASSGAGAGSGGSDSWHLDFYLDAVAAPQWTAAIEDVREEAAALTTAALARAGGTLALAPLRSAGGLAGADTSTVVWVADGREGALSRVELPASPTLAAVTAVLDAGALPAGRAASLLARELDCAEPVAAAVLDHLRGLGVVTAMLPLPRRRARWQPAAALGEGLSLRAEDRPGTSPAAAAPASGWTDVYRRARGGPAPAALHRLGDDVAQAMRLAALLREPAAAGALLLPGIDEHPRSVVDLLAAATERGPEPWPAGGAPAAAGPPDGGTRDGGTPLAAWRSRCADLAPGAGIDVDAAALDALGAPPADRNWPLDCLLRPFSAGGGPTAVLEQVLPAGILDARFAAGLGDLDGVLPQVEAHRSLLASVAETTGIPFLELLVPPVSPRAANAVRRPRYTRLWTGDPDAAGYWGGAGPDDRRVGSARTPQGNGYVPLHRVTLRRDGGRLVAEVDGCRVWPVYHATRSPLPPWDVMVPTLLAAAPRVPSAPFPAGGLPWLGGPSCSPRVTVNGRLVVAPARWRLEAPDLVAEAPAAATVRVGAVMGGDTFAGMRALARWRRRLSVPRFVRLEHGRDGVALDLCSVRSLPLLAAALDGAGGQVVLAESLPEPDRMPVHDLAHGVGRRSAAQLLVRLPAREMSGLVAGQPVPDRAPRRG